MIDPETTYRLQELKTRVREDVELLMARWERIFERNGIPRGELVQLVEQVAQKRGYLDKGGK